MNRKSIGTVLLAALTLVVVGGVSQARAEDHHHDHGPAGRMDANHHFRPYVMHNHHRGYWDQRGGARIWINVD